MKIDNPDHPSHYAYQSSLNRIGATLAFLLTISTIFYLLPLQIAINTIVIVFLLVPLVSYLFFILAVVLKEDAIPQLIYWLKGY